MINKKLWDKCVQFHGHACPGLTIGYQAAVYAKELLGISFSQDEEIVCITENDACGVDAIQVILGCSIGKGNLLFHMRGKQAYSFYNRKTNKSVRLVLKEDSRKMSKKDRFDLYQTSEPKEMFEVKETTLEVPEKARIFNSIVCEHCGEKTSENMIRILDGKKVCLDCFNEYNRFKV
ncbi:MAG: FmdE family protein [Clostridiaceae bacterium]|nr:FmdE family protein [Clostridiaceae bacterium]